MIFYRTKENDIVDNICYKHYGFTCGAVESILKENPEIVQYDDFLPSGLSINLPDIKNKTAPKTIKLWD